MLISLIERFQRDGEHDTIRYAFWAAALRRFKIACEGDGIPEIAEIKQYLGQVPQDQIPGACCDLIAEHLASSWVAGCKTRLDDYLDLIPDLDSLEKLPTDLIEDEFLARHDECNGDFPAIKEYRERFPGRSDVVRKLQSRCLDDERLVKLHRIGCGATSIVWEAFDHITGQIVAIKEAIEGEESNCLRLFESEAAITTDLDHPGIVNISETGHDGKNPPFCVMKMAGEESFSVRIQDHHRNLAEHKKSIRKRCDWVPLLQEVIKICDAMEYSHDHKILHCDLKPGNVVCGENDHPGVIDWGMARKIPITGNERHISGTPEYMPPEQIDGTVSIRSDIYSLGAILYETLTEQPPFLWTQNGIENRPANWPELVRNGAFQRPRKVKRNIPGQLESICLKAMALQPEDRYQSATELSDALRSYLSTKPGPLQFWRG